ncbi:MAG: hypothetical protein KGK07_14710 [Chloroflexota bacterium]|nr:hypothetical protein [Chloroflexota bacterium]
MNHKIDDFLDEVEAVCERHGLTLAHEDGHGAFLVVGYYDVRGGTFADAHDETEKKR